MRETGAQPGWPKCYFIAILPDRRIAPRYCRAEEPGHDAPDASDAPCERRMRGGGEIGSVPIPIMDIVVLTVLVPVFLDLLR